MESTFIDALNSSGIGLGTVVAFIVVLGGAAFAALSFFKKYNKNLIEKTKHEMEENQEDTDEKKELKIQIEDVLQRIGELQELISSSSMEQREMVQNTNEKIQNLEDSVRKIQKESNDNDEELSKKINEFSNQLSEIKSNVCILNEKTNILVESDKESIKSVITEKYYESINQKYIELHTIQSLETLYEKYLKENGNTFIRGLMEELRTLPHTKPKKRSTTTSSSRSKKTSTKINTEET